MLHTPLALASSLGGTVAVGAVNVLASADPSNGTSINITSLITPILSTGIVGVFLLMILFRIKIMPTYVHDDYKAEKTTEIERLESENRELKETNASLRTLTEQQIIPALVRANQLSADYAQDLAAERRNRRRSTDE